ncbi:MAG: anthranilate synthase component II [Candidatus Azotimanducaceae bacterium]|uniref:Aminodeoxychorismate/anthranilate synthase component II n=1 Tax=OM182 bacterium TaxID=2510334 RepID=A0A520S3L0_9GAMM|nr:anthranilate/aminodeoxychorismate synthase component II [Gammaproteobacteria bacterium]OUV67589.1 MAG: anthranilate/aminodeoxychorismate synthase component II [Gammaproteobacteria bacterium TMED133]RZO77055.1 MAG: aminodeoxychorismate/anthranilate synthase component II [OM182 bacterium]
MILMIDNYDSFTYNVVQYLYELEQDVLVKRNDEITLKEISAMRPDHIVISPGPCTPNEAGISLEVVEKFSGVISILGICLGHQSIGQVFGSNVVKAKHVMHGKTSEIYHDGLGIFSGLPSPFLATRYHSLIVDQVPKDMELTGWTMNDGCIDEIMGFRHKDHFVEGVQFHPESILTEHGHALLANFIARKR